MQVLAFTGILQSMGELLYMIYKGVGSYGLAIIIFTILIKIVLMPLGIKSSKASMKMQELQPELKKIQDRYKNDKKKLNDELVKFYKEKEFNPAGGCLPLLLQMPVLLILFRIISLPLTYILGVGQYVEALRKALKLGDSATESLIIRNLTPEVTGKLVDTGVLTQSVAEKILDMKNGMYFLGINLTENPSYKLADLTGAHSFEYMMLLLIPILATVTMFISSKLAMVKTSANLADNPQAQMAKKMMWLGPIMTLIFTFQFPAGLGLYWIVSNIFQAGQQIYINEVVYSKKEEVKSI